MSSLTIYLNRKEQAGLLQTWLPPARFSWSTVLLPHAPVFASAYVHQLCAHPPRVRRTRKLSVPGRVHSISKSCGSQEPSLVPESNPFLTRGTVESPAKYLGAALRKNLRRAAASNQTIGLWVQPRHWLATALKIQLFFIGFFTDLFASSGNIRLAS